MRFAGRNRRVMAMSESVDWQAVQHLTSSTHRREVARILKADGPLTPTAITEKAGISSSSVSRSLGELRENGLVELLVPEETRKGRVYGLTDEGVDAVGVAVEVSGDE